MTKSIRIERISSISIAVALILAVAFAVLSLLSYNQITRITEQTQRYIACEEAASNLQNGTNYLTEQSRLFVITGDTAHLDNYIEELTVSKRRESALASLRTYYDDTDAFRSMGSAVVNSVKLQDTETYAMRLTCESLGMSFDQLPPRLASIILSPEDLALSPEEQQAKAQNLLSQHEYQDARTAVSTSIAQCTRQMIAETTQTQGNAGSAFADIYQKIVAVMGIMAILVVAIAFVNRHLVVHPLRTYGQCIEENKPLPSQGANELRVLVETYNKMYWEKEALHQATLHDAEHDALTGALNRRAFDRLRTAFDENEAPYAFILVDVDLFKNVNDTYGHAVGDMALQRVSSALTKLFRSNDLICRIGGDEFAVFMTGVDSSMSCVVKNKMSQVAAVLKDPEGNVPGITLSAGAAFGDVTAAGKTIVECADEALYQTKQAGRNGCTIYGEQK